MMITCTFGCLTARRAVLQVKVRWTRRCKPPIACWVSVSADYGFEYSDEEVEEEDVDVENQYYNAKSCLEEEDWEVRSLC